jgi:hypothetical protein
MGGEFPERAERGCHRRKREGFEFRAAAGDGSRERYSAGADETGVERTCWRICWSCIVEDARDPELSMEWLQAARF